MRPPIRVRLLLDDRVVMVRRFLSRELALAYAVRGAALGLMAHVSQEGEAIEDRVFVVPYDVRPATLVFRIDRHPICQACTDPVVSGP